MAFKTASSVLTLSIWIICCADEKAVALAGSASLAREKQALQTHANPIRRVVSLLQGLSQKITEEGEKEKKLFDKFMCYCKKSGSEVEKAIAENTDKVPMVQADINGAESKLSKWKMQTRAHSDDRVGVRKEIQAAEKERAGELKQYQEDVTELKEYLNAMSKAIPFIERGQAGAFLQSDLKAPLLSAVESSSSLDVYDRNAILAFLSGTGLRMPTSSEVLGILKQMKAEAEKNLADMESREKRAKENQAQLLGAKNKQDKTLAEALNREQGQLADLGVSIANMKDDQTEVSMALAADQKLAAELRKSCAAKEKEFPMRAKTRGEELVAIQETIKMLNDDDALELFKKALPSSSSLLQLETTARKQRLQALAILRKLPQGVPKPALRLLTMALSGGAVNFGKVIKMLDNMLGLLANEQVDDDTKVEYCNKQIDTAEDKLKSQTRKLSDLASVIAEREELQSTVSTEIASLAQGIKELDRSVSDAVQQRKKEHEEFVELMSSDHAAKELLGLAKNRLMKFYNPKQYKAPKTRRVRQLDNGDLPLVPSKESQSFAQISAHRQGSYSVLSYPDRSLQTTPVLALMDGLVSDLDKEMQEAQIDEKSAQKDYEALLSDSAAKRMTDVKALTQKQDVKAEIAETLVSEKNIVKSEASEKMAMESYKMDLHNECDWLLSNKDLRKTARKEEIDSLKDAKSVLSGADMALTQKHVGSAANEKLPSGHLRGAK